MLHVKCPSCSSPYDLDERKLPASGLPMRCPACGTRFHVERDGSIRAEAEAVGAASTEPPKRRGGLGPASLRVLAELGLEDDLPAKRPSSLPPKSAYQPPSPPVRVATKKKPLAPPVSATRGSVDEADLPAPATTSPRRRLAPVSATRGNADEADLPAPATASPRRRLAPPVSPPEELELDAIEGEVRPDPPAPKRRLAPPPPAPRKAPAVPGASLDADLPAPAPRKSPGLGKSAPRKPPAPQTSARKIEADLPAPVANKPKAAGGRAIPGAKDADLPAPARAHQPAKPVTPARKKPIAPPVDLPAPASVGKKPSLDLDLPAPASVGKKPSLDLDLPAPAVSSSTPSSPGLELDLPGPIGPASSSLDLPAPVSVGKKPSLDLDLPAPAVPASSPNSSGLELDLPGPVGAASPGFDLDLPAPASPGLEFELPAPAKPKTGAQVKSLEFEDLPMPSGGGELRLDLSMPPSGAPIRADLPAPSADLPAPSFDGPVTSDLPMPAGDVSLPAPSAQNPLDLPGVHIPTGGRGALPVNPFDAVLDADIKIDSSFDAPDLSGGFEFDLPEARDLPFDAPPAPGAGGAEFGALDFDADAAAAGAAGLEFDELPEQADMDMPLDAAFDLPSSLPPAGQATPLVRTSVAPGEKAPSKMGAPGEAVRPVRGDAGTKGSGKKKLPKGLIALVATLVLVVAAGVGLKFTNYGLFGQYFVEQFRPEAGTAASTTGALDAAESLAADGTYGGERAALQSLSEARRSEYFNRALMTASVVEEVLFQLRFGPSPRSDSRIQAIMRRLETRGNDAPGFQLAEGALALVEGDAPLGAQTIERGRSEAASEIQAALLAGEAALLNGNAEQAEAEFSEAGQSARALWGVARARLMREGATAEEQQAAIDATLAASPNHASALIAAAGLAAARGEVDRAMSFAETATSANEQATRGSTRERAEAHVLLGDAHADFGMHSRAKGHYESALRLNASNPQGLLGLGRIFVEERRFREAETRFRAAIQSAPEGSTETNEGEARLSLADEARLGLATTLVAQDAPLEAAQLAQEVLTNTPNHPEALLVHGQALFATEDTEGALAQFDAAIAAAPDAFEPYLAKAAILTELGRNDEASATLAEAQDNIDVDARAQLQLADAHRRASNLTAAARAYEASLEGEPGNVRALFGLGVTLRRLGQNARAETLLSQVMELDPSYPSLAYERGRLFEASGQSRSAVTEFERAVEAQPEDMELQVRFGGALLSAGELERAREVLEPLEVENSDSAELAFTLGRLALKENNPAEARRQFERARILEPSVMRYRTYQAWALVELGEFGSASSEIDAVLESADTSPVARMVRGYVRLRTGASADAAEDFEAARLEAPRLADAHAGLAEAMAELGRGTEAVAAYQTATSIDGSHPDWWHRLALAAQASGQNDVALSAATQAINFADERNAPYPVWAFDAYRIRGDVLYRSNRAEAIGAYQTFLERAPGNALDRAQVQRRVENAR